MDLDLLLNLLNAVLIIGVAIPSLYMARRVKQPRLRMLALLLAAFLLLHGLYHATSAVASLADLEWMDSLADALIEPLGWVVFLGFAVIFWRTGK